MMSIEDVHRLLEVTEDALSLLGQWRHEKIDVGDIGDFCLAVAEVLEWQTAYSDASVRLGVAANILTRYAKFRGPFQAREATVVAQRIRSFLKSQDQASVMPSRVSAQTPEQQQARKPEPMEQSKFAFQADGWISIQNDVQVKQKIMAVSVLLDSIIEQISHSNYPEDQRAISAIERAQLIAVLETVLAVLKAPMVEKALIKKADGLLVRVSKKVLEKQTEEGLGSLIDLALEQLRNLRDMFWP